MRPDPHALALFRSRADPLADAAVAALTHRAEPNQTALELVRAGAREGNPAQAAFVAHTDRVPGWADFAAMEPGRRAAMRQAPLTFLVLLTDSLIESFAIPHGAQVLARTGRLQREPVPRLYETAAMVRDALLEDGLRPGREGHTALLRVRLLHAFVRRFIRKTPGWDSSTFGEPVNQTDMVHTLMMFSLVLARGVQSLGASWSEAERRSWCHLWRYAGYMLGVDEELLFTGLEQERALYALVREHHYRPDDTSRSLAFSVLEALSGEPPFYLPKQALFALTRRMLGEGLADQFRLPRSRRWEAIVAAFVVGNRGVDLLARAAPKGETLALAGSRAFIELNRWRVERQGNLSAYAFRTIPKNGA